jgi:hypothetical protein
MAAMDDDIHMKLFQENVYALSYVAICILAIHCVCVEGSLRPDSLSSTA